MSFVDPDYTTPIEMTFDVGKPIRSEQGGMLAGNPIAIVRGKSLAPIVEAQWHPYDATTVGGGGDGLIYDHSADGTVSFIQAPTFEAGYTYAFMFENLGTSFVRGSPGDPGDFLKIQIYRDPAGSYQDGAITSTEYETTTTTIGRPNGVFGLFAAGLPSLNPGGAWLVYPPGGFGINADWGNSTAQSITTARIRWNAGSINAGKVYMLKRLDYLSLALVP